MMTTDPEYLCGLLNRAAEAVEDPQLSRELQHQATEFEIELRNTPQEDD